MGRSYVEGPEIKSILYPCIGAILCGGRSRGLSLQSPHLFVLLKTSTLSRRRRSKSSVVLGVKIRDTTFSLRVYTYPGKDQKDKRK